MQARPEPRLERDDGFTLIELMVSLTILTIVIAASFAALGLGLTVSRSTTQRVAAADVVNNVLDQLHASALTAAGFAAIPVTTESLAAQTVGSTTYDLSQTAEWVADGQSASLCTSAATSSLLLRVTVSASWPGDISPVSSTTVFNPPPGTFSSVDGALAVTVLSSTGSPLSGVTVTASSAGQTAQSIVTGADGCAFFAQLPPGGWSVAAGGVTGLIDSLEHQPPANQTVTISSGQPAALTFTVDTAGTITYTLGASTPAAPAASGMGASVYSTQWLSSETGSMSPFGSATGSLTVFPASYGVFAGTCTDANPFGTDSSSGSPFYSSGASTAVTVSPGGAPASIALPLYYLSLTATNSSNVVDATAASPPGTPPTAAAGATSLPDGGSCPAGAPTWTLAPVSAGVSNTAVGLGHLAITMTVDVGGTTETGTANVWVRPSGVYNYNTSTGTVGSLIYSYSSPGTVDVPVS